ncbi:MAG TPA: hypothetical protein PKE40_04155 [Arachnia sp.]|nr:hypothetical protein [Arachnia sp.]HMT85525.1 hypothetical protein [Arachnia sp.]
MKIKKQIVAAAAVAITITAVAPATASHAAADVTWSSGSWVRARLYENANFGGAVMTVKGQGEFCSTSTSDRDTIHSRLSISGWNDVISSARDYQKCDVNLFVDLDFGGAQTGFVNYDSTGANLSSTMNDKASSFILS